MYEQNAPGAIKSKGWDYAMFPFTNLFNEQLT